MLNYEGHAYLMFKETPLFEDWLAISGFVESLRFTLFCDITPSSLWLNFFSLRGLLQDLSFQIIAAALLNY